MRAYRSVIWMAKGAMETYDFKTRVHDAVNTQGGGQVRALQLYSHATSGTSILIPSLLYSPARLPSTLLQIEEASVAGVEIIGGRPCHKVSGVTAAYYPSGAKTGMRPVTVWIDVESQLIRKVLEDTPTNLPAGSFSRLTITLDPQANPAIEDDRFAFKIPSG